MEWGVEDHRHLPVRWSKSNKPPIRRPFTVLLTGLTRSRLVPLEHFGLGLVTKWLEYLELLRMLVSAVRKARAVFGEGESVNARWRDRGHRISRMAWESLCRRSGLRAPHVVQFAVAGRSLRPHC